MDEKNILKNKSKRFAVRIVNLSKYLNYDKNETIMAKQVLRSGTSIGANIAEAEYAVSKSDFFNKLSIALKETSETIYWLEILKETEYISTEQFCSMFDDCEELRKMLAASTKTLKDSKET